MGGAAHDWSTTLATDLIPGGAIELHLVMTKFGPPAVAIGYEVRVSPVS